MNHLKLWCGILVYKVQSMAPIFFISKPSTPFPDDYYYFKFKGYSILAQAVVDCKKRFTNICIGMPWRVNDSCVLHRFALYKQVQLHGLFDITRGSCEDGIPPYFLVIKNIPLLIKSWCHLKKMDTITFYNYFTTKNTKRPIHGGECFWHSQEKFQGINV
jgi:hypothetical protein